jgi:hypothetical protein
VKKALPFFFSCMIVVVALSQDLWLSPQRFYFTIRDIAHIRFLQGVDFAGKDWSVDSRTVSHLVLYEPSEALKDLSLATGNNSLQLSLREEGTYMVVGNSTNSSDTMDAANFDQYLKSQGLDHVNLFRKQHGEENAKGKYYSQYDIKTIFQVGGKITDRCLQASLLPLDILPEENPYAVQEGTNSEKPVKKRFQIIFDRQPLHNVLVRVLYRGTNNIIRTDSARTNRRGMVSIDRHPGPNLISCTYMVRNQPDTEVQWQAYHASLSFEYSRFFPGKTGR